jgi:hypothetical protein
VLASTPAALAQDLGGGRIEIDLKLYDDDGQARRRSDEDVRRFFNLANCVCNEPFVAELTLVGAREGIPSQAVHVYVGQDCERFDDPRHGERCEEVRVLPDLRDLRTPTSVDIPVGTFMFPNRDTCEITQSRRWVYVMVEDPDQPDPVPVANLGILVDTEAPPVVRDPRLSPGENAAQLRWSIPDARADDLYEYQVLCARADGTSGGEAFGDEPRYATADLVCGADDGVRPEPTATRLVPPTLLQDDGGPGEGIDAGPDTEPGPDAGPLPADLPQSLIDLDPGAICATGSGSTRTSVRVDGLENGVLYHIVLVAIDRARNPRPMYLGVVEPRPAINYWDDYKDRGGGAEGGYCFVATASFGGYDSPNVLVLRELRDGTLAHFALGRAFIAWYYEKGPALAALVERHALARVLAVALLVPIVVAAAIWNAAGPLGVLAIALAMFLAHAAGRVARRRARSEAARPGSRRLTAFAVAGALVALVPASARAQAGFYDFSEPADPPGPPPVAWNAELKFGGYFPAMDRGFDGTGPFETMFGTGPFFISKITADRFFLYPGGQLGLTASAGYFSRSAQAFATDAGGGILLDDQGDPVRSEGDTTTFRLVPTSVGVVYRYTQLDDHLGIPFVPYGRAGLSYYLWWVTQPDGSIAQAEGSRARGGSFGWEASAGLALRAERLDRAAARSLRNEFGIAHAGFFAEASYARVDSFGRNNRLPVGGLSILGGINFEF